MRMPPCLSKGDTIAIAAPARKTSREELQFAVQYIEKQGYKVRLDETVFNIENQFAGSDEERTLHFQHLLDDAEVKAIICARGGYGTLRIIDSLDFSEFVQRPKWIVGYSDITVLHAHLNQVLKIESLHATMPINFETNSPQALDSLFKSLIGEKISYSIDPHLLNINGKCSSELVGGNLSILYSLVGSADFPETEGKILFIEDLDEYLYHIDRMILSLKRAAIFKGLAGLIVGGMTEMKDNTVPFGKTAEEIIAGHIAEYDFPICYGFPAGHIADNRALIMGRKYNLEVGNEVKLSEV